MEESLFDGDILDGIISFCGLRPLTSLTGLLVRPSLVGLPPRPSLGGLPLLHPSLGGLRDKSSFTATPFVT